MHGGGFVEDFGRSAPDHRQAGGARILPEVADVLHQHLGLIHLAALGLDVGAVDAFDELVIEHRLHGTNRRKRLAQLVEHRALEDTGLLSGLYTIVTPHSPGTTTTTD